MRSGERLYTQEDLERLEVILKLTRDFGVNLAGVEIILNMREKMAGMQRQIEELVRTLNEELAVHIPAPSKEERHSLIPVITLPPVTQAKKSRGN
jgi:MerR family transcriptional regulator/heat shock protein HspR